MINDINEQCLNDYLLIIFRNSKILSHFYEDKIITINRFISDTNSRIKIN